MATTLYGIYDPAGQLRYVGKTAGPISQRLREHLSKARRGDRTYRSAWLRSLKAPPTIQAFAIVSDEDAAETERRFIAMFRNAGERLVNLTDGGDGTLGWKPSEETRRRISNAHTGKIVPREYIEKMLAANRGRPLSAEHKEKLRAMHKLRSAETRAKLRLAALRWHAAKGHTMSAS